MGSQQELCNPQDALLINTIDKPLMETNYKKRRTLANFFRKYFLEGQKMQKTNAIKKYSYVKPTAKDSNVIYDITEIKYVPQSNSKIWFVSIIKKNPKLFAFLFPFTLMHLVWWMLAFQNNFFCLYYTRFEMPLTMILGATVAGMTSEGGGAVAFPVMTLLLKVEPKDARDFSLMIQSCGMTSAAFTIIWMGIKLEWNAIIVCTISSTIGIVFGLEFMDDLLDGSQKKMLFVAIWFSFALSLFILNFEKKRITFDNIQKLNTWKVIMLASAGFVGGLCSAFAGSGVDICTFSMITLLFRVTEKVATPTSVVLMGVNTCVGFFWRQIIMNDISQLSWEYFLVSIPVVVICAPMGSLLASHFHRLVLATFVYVLEILAVIGFLLTRPDVKLILAGILIIFASFTFFVALSCIGSQIHCKELKHINEQRMINNVITHPMQSKPLGNENRGICINDPVSKT